MDPGTDWVGSESKIALDFDGTDDHIVLPTITLSSYYSISFWAILRGAGPGIVIGDSVQSSTYIWLYPGNNFRCDINGTVSMQDGTQTVFSSWTHYCVTIGQDANPVNKSGKIYRNGRLTHGPVALATPTFAITRLATGRIGNQFYFNGNIDDVRIYDRELPASEVNVLALRRGIAYETVRNRRGKKATAGGTFKAAWARKPAQIIGGR